jgi:hypothetical protein
MHRSALSALLEQGKATRWLRAMGTGCLVAACLVPGLIPSDPDTGMQVSVLFTLLLSILWARSLQEKSRMWMWLSPIFAVLHSLFGLAFQGELTEPFSLFVALSSAIACLPHMLFLWSLFALPERYFLRLAEERGGALARDDAWRALIYGFYTLIPLVMLGGSILDEVDSSELTMFVLLSVGGLLSVLPFVRSRAQEMARAAFLKRVTLGEEPNYRVLDRGGDQSVLVRVAETSVTAYRSAESEHEEIGVLGNDGIVTSPRPKVRLIHR